MKKTALDDWVSYALEIPGSDDESTEEGHSQAGDSLLIFKLNGIRLAKISELCVETTADRSIMFRTLYLKRTHSKISVQEKYEISVSIWDERKLYGEK